MVLASSSDRLTVDEVRSLAVARARIPRALAGGTRLLWELATGAPSVEGEPPITVRNPDGEIGVNRSGYPWGPALRHPLWSTSGCNEDPASLAFGKTWVDEVETGEVRRWTITLRVRPFTMRPNTPYSRGYLSARVRNASAGAGTSSAKIRAWRLGEPDIYREATVSGGTANQVDILYVDLRRGQNRIVIEVRDVTTRGLRIDSLSLNQVATRTH